MKQNQENKNIHAGHRQRLRENVDKNGLLNMHDHQVLEYMLTFVLPQKDVNGLSHALIERFGSFSKVLEADTMLLKTVNGVGDVVAHFLHNFRDMFYFYQRNKVRTVNTLWKSDETVQYFSTILSGKIVEELHLLGLDSKNRIVYSNVVERGTSNFLNVTIRKITSILISNNISNIIIAHNHPAGTSCPSASDDQFTHNLYVSLGTNGIHLLDHIIIGEDGYYSYFSNGKIADYREKYGEMLAKSDLAQNAAKYVDTLKKDKE